ncbi:hypothetical protein DL770_001208 [Monosporascus sp. CRB-9-2]|nr:hypothetical protein DL770_001208 [Monosporascus sp. CRB-9-2]
MPRGASRGLTRPGKQGRRPHQSAEGAAGSCPAVPYDHTVETQLDLGEWELWSDLVMLGLSACETWNTGCGCGAGWTFPEQQAWANVNAFVARPTASRIAPFSLYGMRAPGEALEEIVDHGQHNDGPPPDAARAPADGGRRLGADRQEVHVQAVLRTHSRRAVPSSTGPCWWFMGPASSTSPLGRRCYSSIALSFQAAKDPSAFKSSLMSLPSTAAMLAGSLGSGVIMKRTDKYY